MKVALAGVGDVGRYLIEELPKEGIEFVALTRSPKAWLSELGVVQRTTDYYSEASLAEAIKDCDAVVSVVTPAAPDFLDVHLALLKACVASPHCKRFIPSYWGADLDKFPDQPLFGRHMNETLLNALRAQSEVRWSVVCLGYFADYIVPVARRYLKDHADIWVQHHETKVFTLYGEGSQTLDLTSARDAARATARFLTFPAEEWDEFLFVSGEHTTWRGIWELLEKREPGSWTLQRKSLGESIQEVVAAAVTNGSPDLQRVGPHPAMYQIVGHSEATAFDPAKVDEQRQNYFRGLKFRSLAELADEADAYPDRVI